MSKYSLPYNIQLDYIALGLVDLFVDFRITSKNLCLMNDWGILIEKNPF